MNILWYLTRATGEVAILFLSTVLALGVLSATRVGGRRVPRFVIAGLHRNLTLVSLAFIAVHVLTTLVDSYAPIGLTDVVVPFVAEYRPIWLGLGALAFDALLAVTVTSLLRVRLGYRRWRMLHWAAYGCWLAALVHALGTGSDVRASLFLILTGACVGVALTVVAWRLAVGSPDHLALRLGAGALTLVITIAVGVWTVRGPLAAGWARRSGTPERLIGHSGAAPLDGPAGDDHG